MTERNNSTTTIQVVLTDSQQKVVQNVWADYADWVAVSKSVEAKQ